MNKEEIWINIILKMLDAFEIGSILPLDMMVYDIIFASKKVEFLWGLDDICVVFSRFTSKHSKWFSCLYDWWSWTRTILMSDLTGCVRKEKLGIPRWCGWKEKTIVNCWVIVIFNSLFLDIKCLVIPVTNKVSTQMGLCNTL